MTAVVVPLGAVIMLVTPDVGGPDDTPSAIKLVVVPRESRRSPPPRRTSAGQAFAPPATAPR
jgi:hypothetical protein